MKSELWSQYCETWMLCIRLFSVWLDDDRMSIFPGPEPSTTQLTLSQTWKQPMDSPWYSSHPPGPSSGAPKVFYTESKSLLSCELWALWLIHAPIFLGLWSSSLGVGAARETWLIAGPAYTALWNSAMHLNTSALSRTTLTHQGFLVTMYQWMAGVKGQEKVS